MDPALPTKAVAVFRAQITGPALLRSLSRGELAALLRELASKEYLPPGANVVTALAPRRWSGGTTPIAGAA